MHQDVINRRNLLVGVTACALAPTFPPPARAFWPALVTGINTLVALWNGFKMAEEVYKRIFEEKQQQVTREIERIYIREYVVVPQYYQFRNPYDVPGLAEEEPGCECFDNRRPDLTALCCGSEEDAIYLPTGCIIALDAAIEKMRESLEEDNVFAYTRPIRYAKPVEPWQEIDDAGSMLKTDLQYYSASGSVSLRWLITNREQRLCRGEYKIRDDDSQRIIIDDQTDEFSY